MDLSKMESRKFIIWAITAILFTVAFFMGKINADQWLVAFSGSGLGYGILNQVEKWITTPDAPKPTTNSDPGEPGA